MPLQKTDMPYPSEIKQGREEHDAAYIRNRQMYALEAARLAVSSTACQGGHLNPAEHANATLALADRLLVFILGE